MKHSLTYLLSELALYAEQNELLRKEDEAYVMNGWLSLMRGTELTDEEKMQLLGFEQIAKALPGK